MATTNATAPKGAPKKQSQGFTGIKSGFTVIILCCIIAVCIYLFVFGSASNFKGDIVWTLQPYIDAEIGWNVDTEDWRRPGADTIASRIMKAKPGSVILMHDGGGDRSQTVEALKKALPQLKQEGYRFVTISELLQYDPPADSSVSK